MKKFSTELAGVLVAVVGSGVVAFLGKQGISESCSNEMSQFVPVIIGGAITWIARVRKGDVGLAGFKKY